MEVWWGGGQGWEVSLRACVEEEGRYVGSNYATQDKIFMNTWGEEEREALATLP